MSNRAWPAPAKINLFLHVTGRRGDGYHELQTVFQFLDYADELRFMLTDDGLVRRDGEGYGVAEEEDLTVRAARALQEATGTDAGVRMRIDKRIPAGGGLGGGSSDAATTLVALNRLWALELPEDELARIGLELGADVPVFVRGRAAWAEGVGERLQPVELPEDWFLVVHPGCHVPTGRVFNAPDLTRNTPPITIRDFLDGAGHNDCEPVVFEAFPQVAEAARWLGRFAPDVRMTGTGACLFARFPSREEAEAVARDLPNGYQGFVARGRNRSPLLDRLAAE
ncbi:MAG: 4-(cytidine 5'-diphospho)-2-C-methyl-D-erythritol kinase [Gammaproteobacteria bacterium]